MTATTEATVNVKNNYEAQQENLNKRIERGREKAGNILDTIQNDGNLLNDFILNLGNSSPINFTSNGKVKMQIQDAEYTMHPHAVVQTGERLGINSTYIKDLANSSLDWKRELISHDLNTFVANTERNRVLVRTVGSEVRGVLTDAYKRINSAELYKTFIEATQNLDMQVIDAHYDGLQGYLESVYPKVFSVATPRNGDMYFGFGARMRNSDFGVAPYELSLFAFQVVCYNGMQKMSAIKEVHLGRRLPEDLRLADDTLIADTRARNLIARDAIRSIMSPKAIEQTMAQIQQASDIVIDVDGKLKEISKSGKMDKGEIETLKRVITNNKPEDGVQGENTLLKLSQAIGRVGVISKDEARKRELDALAYNLMVKKS